MADVLSDSSCTTDAVENIIVDGTRQMILLEDGVDDETLKRKLIYLRDLNYFENVFSWDMKEASKSCGTTSIEFKTIEEFREMLQEQELVTLENGLELFSLHK